MNERNDNSAPIDERTELLITRYLDGEIGPEDRAELERILADSPAARELLAEYQRNDVLAASVLHADTSSEEPRGLPMPSPRRHTSMRLAWVGGLIAAAAVVAFSFLPDFVMERGKVAQFDKSRMRQDSGVLMPADDPALPRGGYRNASSPYPAYRHVDDVMLKRQNNTRREWIGIPSPTEEGVIYIIERKRTSTRITPISGDI